MINFQKSNRFKKKKKIISLKFKIAVKSMVIFQMLQDNYISLHPHKILKNKCSLSIIIFPIIIKYTDKTSGGTGICLLLLLFIKFL